VLELWSNNIGEYYPQLIEEGKVEVVGDIGLKAREGWLYPKYMEEQCPGLPA
jgi:glycine betaine/proline transport system substrate-binding protein